MAETGQNTPYALMNIPSWLQIVDTYMDNIAYKRILIKTTDSDDHATIDAIIQSLSEEVDDSAVSISEQYSTE